MKISDVNLIKSALNVYIRHLKGFDDEYIALIKRCEELQSKEIISNSLVLTIKLES